MSSWTISARENLNRGTPSTSRAWRAPSAARLSGDDAREDEAVGEAKPGVGVLRLGVLVRLGLLV
ncbi:MAG: hypothetical protein CL849_00480, partial [Crocinitomicaceae bacterium]|nr:hypothetical protein [Crocinitomicaceae bacterium]